jgi:glycosyltransferase involved in cell wall biosynthesis
MRICLVYDCLFPHTVGGAERWYRNLAERLAADGHEVTYLTLRQWRRNDGPNVSGVRVRAVGPRMSLYAGPGRRRILPPLVFGAGVLWHLLRHGRDYDAVHTAAFPYFSLLAAGLMRSRGRYRLVVDWHEVWSREYWREYLGRIGGRIGFAVQAMCMRIHQQAFCFSRLVAERLRDGGLRGSVRQLEGEYAGGSGVAVPAASDGTVVFAGRHIPEKHAPAVVGAVAEAAQVVHGLKGVIFGDGPERTAVLAEIERLHAGDFVTAPGFVEADTVERSLATALCLLHPSRREGYGMIVVEAAALGVPSILVAAADNAAVELIDEDQNGVVATSTAPSDLAAAILEVAARGPALRTSTADWFSRNADRLSVESSLEAVLAAYREPSTRS